MGGVRTAVSWESGPQPPRVRLHARPGLLPLLATIVLLVAAALWGRPEPGAWAVGMLPYLLLTSFGKGTFLELGDRPVLVTADRYVPATKASLRQTWSCWPARALRVEGFSYLVARRDAEAVAAAIAGLPDDPEPSPRPRAIVGDLLDRHRRMSGLRAAASAEPRPDLRAAAPVHGRIGVALGLAGLAVTVAVACLTDPEVLGFWALLLVCAALPETGRWTARTSSTVWADATGIWVRRIGRIERVIAIEVPASAFRPFRLHVEWEPGEAEVWRCWAPAHRATLAWLAFRAEAGEPLSVPA